MMSQELQIQLIPVFLTAAIAAFGYLLSAFFGKIHKDIEELTKSLEGMKKALEAIK